MNPSTQLAPYRTRRSLLRTAATAALTAPMLAACVTAGKETAGTREQGEKTADNPLGVRADAPLEVVVFKGGYGDDYATRAEATYVRRYPRAKVDHKGLQKVGEAMQPRFVAGNPPDVVDNTGAGRLDMATLVGAGQLTDLADLLDAPALDQPGRTVRETLLPGVVEDGTFAGTTVALNLTYTVWGLWYSRSLFAERGWNYPATWTDMLSLCAEIRKAGVAPWTYQGKYPEYLNDPLLGMAARTGGPDLIKAVDNLQPNAWRQDALVQAATAFAELAGRGYLMSGSEALSHTEAQAAWCRRRAAFIPCGSWLESEQQGVTPAGFDMVMGLVPTLTGGDRLKLQAASSESFVVPAKAENPAGGKEFLRILFSKASATDFAKANSTLPAVAGATDGLTLSSGLASVRDAVTAAGDGTFTYRFRTWYAPLAKAVDDATGELVNRRISPADWSTRMQKAADALARDTTVTKYTR